METNIKKVSTPPEGYVSFFEPTHVGELIQEELKERGIKQKDFAEAIGILPSHLNEIIKGKRDINAQIAISLEKELGISAKLWLDTQTHYYYDLELSKQRDVKEQEARNIINEYNEAIDVKTILKKLKYHIINDTETVQFLQNVLHLPEPANMQLATSGLFKKSEKVGRDPKMIHSWVILAKYYAEQEKAINPYEADRLPELEKKLVRIFHENVDTINKVKQVLSEYGITFSIVEKLDKASVDAFSFTKDGNPHIIVTLRKNTIDNFAFSVMHELSHIKNSDEENVNTGEEQDEREKTANRYAAETLIDDNLWKRTPKVPVYQIQTVISKWALANNLNPWIVLGRIAYETGMYKFRGSASRAIK